MSFPKKFLKNKLLKIKRKIKRRSRFTAVFSLCFGLSLFFSPFYLRLFNSYVFALNIRNKQINLSSNSDNSPIRITEELISFGEVFGDYPVKIIVPGAKIDLVVKPARVIGGVWEINDNAANFGIGSALPGEKGNSVIFAHAKPNLFSSLKRIKPDDMISIQTKDGNWYAYKAVEKKEVGPDQVEVISQTKDETLTLFTCSGFADSKRLIVTAKLMK